LKRIGERSLRELGGSEPGARAAGPQTVREIRSVVCNAGSVAADRGHGHQAEGTELCVRLRQQMARTRVRGRQPR
jgi:hypothetical protein